MAPTDPSLYCPDCGGRLSTEAWGEDLCLACLLRLAAPTTSSGVVVATEAPTALLGGEPGDEFEATVPPGGGGYEATAPAGAGGYEATAAPGRSRTTEVAAEFTFSQGQVLGDRYRVLKRLGRGGMGEVWRAYDIKLRMDVALKTLLMTMGGGEEALEILRGEVRAAREVISPNVCRLFDIIEIDGQELVSMEYIDGQTLMDLLDERCPLEIQEAGEIGSQFLAGLEAIHQAGLVHRDIKPENIMLTRSGRVVIMDFGLTAPSGTGVLAGTPAYMPPEQGRGEATDARADVFSAGMVLSEMLSAERGPEASSRQTFWENVRKEPPILPESPWSRILVKAVAASPVDRYDSAAELARTLEEIAVRVEGAEDKKPYPGLESFGEDAAEFFFGREAEVEALWKKLQQSTLLGLIGASGAGKSSFVNAGLLPARPEGWVHLKIKPGPAPFVALGSALSDSALEDTEGLLAAVRTWRAQHGEVLLIVDQFEELFTQNPLEVQESFTDLLRRVALEEDVHVLLSMRDDFLIQCQRFDALAPVFSELTPLGPPLGTALRRALIQPARKCGYRFEDDSMVEEMLEEVTKERGALPLIAFTTARLWEERDQDSGLLTRQAYDRMGGVEGALAQHAEATLETIGKKRRKIVRELFRNLVTAQGTRAVMEVDEVLSVFSEDRAAAAEVVQSLIDARLLTTYEVRSAEDEEPQRRVEIVHESLLSAWPRLVRWRTQDAEGAQLRDELRQAARLWEARGRSVDLLWTGTAFREFELWRERYPGRLTAVEEDFAAAMTSFETRRARRRRIALATLVAGLVGVVVVLGTMWRKSEASLAQAEASGLYVLGTLERDSSLGGAVAYALASLEIADDPDTRRLALETLWRGPTSLNTGEGEAGFVGGITFSPDGNWLAATAKKGLRLWPSSGGEPRRLGGPEHDYWAQPVFAKASSLLAAACNTHEVIDLFSIPEGELVRSIEIDDFQPEGWLITADDTKLVTVTENGESLLAQSWPLPEGEPVELGRFEQTTHSHGSSEWLVGHEGTSIHGRRLAALQDPEQLLGWHEENVTAAAFSPDGQWMASGDSSGEVRIWSLAAGPESPLRTLSGDGGSGIRDLAFDATGRWLAVAVIAGAAQLWDLQGPPAADPLLLEAREMQVNALAFSPDGEWLATAGEGMRLWPLKRPYSRVLRGHEAMTLGVGFAADGSWLVSSSADGKVRQWPLTPVAGPASRVLYEHPLGHIMMELAVDPGGRFVLAAASGSGGTWLLPLGDDEPRELPDGFDQQAWHVALSLDGRFVAAADGLFNGPEGVIRVWDLENGGVRILDPGEGNRGNTWNLDFTADNRLVSGGYGGARSWNVEDGTFELLQEGEGEEPIVASGVSPNGRFLATFKHYDEHLLLRDLESGEARQVTSQVETFGGHSDWKEIVVDSAGEMLVTAASNSGDLYAGPVTGEDAHRLLGHEGGVWQIAFSPDGQWIGSVGRDSTVRLWPRPEGKAFHTLPYEDLLDRLRALTNLRAVRDDEAPGGYRLEPGRFPGWDRVPTW